MMYWHFEAAYVSNLLKYVLIAGRTAVWILRFYGIHLFYTLGALSVDLGIFLVLLLQPKLELKRTSQAFLKNLLTLGTISYGVYVWHSVVLLAFDIDFANAGRPVIYGAMLVTLALAWVMYKLYEHPFLSYKKYNSNRTLPVQASTP